MGIGETKRMKWGRNVLLYCEVWRTIAKLCAAHNRIYQT